MLGPVLTVVALCLGASGEEEMAKRQGAFEEAILGELGAIAPAAVDSARAAGEAYRADHWQAALDGYAKVLTAAPGFPHALRRQCTAASQLGQRDVALPLCRQAVTLAPRSENWVALARVLATGHPSRKPTMPETAEAQRLARQALSAAPDDPDIASGACAVALETEGHQLLSFCVARLDQLVPGTLPAEYFGVLDAAIREDFTSARRRLTAARDAGLDATTADRLEASLDRVEPPWRRHGPSAAVAVGVWAALLALLLVAGSVLSMLTLRGAPQLAAARGQDAGRGGLLRRLYAGVLWLTCAAYYLSLPLVLGLVLSAAALLWFAFAALGQIPVKLLLIVGVVVLVSVWAVLKSLWASLIRPKVEDPGIVLDVAAHPRLAHALAEVAGRVGTRVVDRVFLTPGTEAAVFERGGLARQLVGRSERCLIVGVGLLEGMTQGQLKAVLAHEYGHFVNRDTAGGGLALAVRRSIVQMAESLAQGGAASWYNPAWLFVTGFYRLFLRVSQGASRLQEILADRWAALAYGGAAFAGGLTHAVTRSIRFDRHANATIKEVIEGELALRNLYRYTPRASAPPDGRGQLDGDGSADGSGNGHQGGQAEADVLETEEQQAMCREPSPYDSHPRPADRIAWVGDLPSSHPIEPSEALPAWELFSDREALERRLTDEVRANIEARHGIAIPADDERTTAPGN